MSRGFKGSHSQEEQAAQEDRAGQEVLRAAESATPARTEATRVLLAALRSPLALMSTPTRERVMALAREHGITAEELLDLAVQNARHT